ncbi:ATP-grasp domain-containing protein [Eudoraea chungangensis]|uniref:ATP-grasp domain-containing protein n=1 Tax=Eudoraea chungangensis TaxID=1481905 RepID=UPI0023ED36DE|nr:ATP-grasp domain-containing protein [Eudoraea chungangensis]
MYRDNSKISVLIPDAHSKYMPLVLNCLSLFQNVRIHLLSTEKFNAPRFSKNIKSYSYCGDKTYSEKWVERVQEAIKKHQIDIILPVQMESFPVFTKLQDVLPKKVALVPLPQMDSFKTASNKWFLAKHLEQYGIPGPRTSLFKSSQKSLDLDFPCLLKPMKDSGGGEGIIKFSSLEELRGYLIEKKEEDTIMIQEFMEGDPIGCNVLCMEGKVLAYTIQKGYLFIDKPYSPQVGLYFFKKDKIYKTVSRLMHSLNWNGVANIDMIYNDKTGEFKILEINPRFWLSLDASALAGVNFPYLYLQLGLGNSIAKQDYKLEKYVNLKGLYLLVKKNPKVAFNFKFLWNNTSLRFALKDPLPIGYHFLWRSRNIILSKLKMEKKKS